jgi:hypothetical protein
MGGSSVAMLAPYGGRLGLGRLLPNRIRCTSLGIFCTVSLCVCRVCDRTLRPFPVGGPFPCQQTYSFNPARPSTASLAGKMPPLREGDRYFWGCAYWRSYCSYHLPMFGNQESPIYLILLISRFFLFGLHRLIHKAAHSDVHYHP